MISRERILNAIAGKQPDRVPIDIGGFLIWHGAAGLSPLPSTMSRGTYPSKT